MSRPASIMDARLALLLLVLLAPGALARSSMRARCSACRAVGEVLSKKLEEEVPRNHLDLRHRLDKEGKRWGKVIDYKMSELRVIHLLEDLCDGMARFELVAGNDTQPARWARSSSLGVNKNYNLHLVKEQRKELENYCADLLERHEDTLSHALRNGEVDMDTISDFLCYITARHCDNPLPPPEAPEVVAAEEGAEQAAAVTEAGAEGVAAKQGGQEPEAGTAATATAGSVKRDEL